MNRSSDLNDAERALPKRDEGDAQSIKTEVASADADIRAAGRDRSFAQDDSVWKLYLGEAKIWDDEFAKVCSSDLNSLLIFAGLFSAVLTPLLIESRKELQQDPQETTNSLLNIVAQRLQNSTFTPTPDSRTTFEPSSSWRWVNGLWFSSLTFSLVSALGSILVQGCVSEYAARSPPGVPMKDACSRHRRFMGIHRWGIGIVIKFVPALIHAALFLFFAGLVIFVWHDEKVIAKVLLAFVAATAGCYLLSTLLPLLFPDCPYRTPIFSVIRSLWGEDTRAEPASADKALAIAWLLSNSTNKETVDVSVKAAASLPANEKGVLRALYQKRVADVLSHGLRESVERKASSPPTVGPRAKAYLQAILQLLQTEPPDGRKGDLHDPIGGAIVSLAQDDGPLSHWYDLGRDICEVALCVKARIALFYPNPGLDNTQGHSVEPKALNTAARVLMNSPSSDSKRMLAEVILLNGTKFIMDKDLSFYQYPKTPQWNSAVKDLAALSTPGKIYMGKPRMIGIRSIEVVVSRLRNSDAVKDDVFKFANCGGLRRDFIQRNGIYELVQMLAPNRRRALDAVVIISELGKHDVRKELADFSIPKLVDLVKQDTEGVHSETVKAISVLFGYEDFRTPKVIYETIEGLVSAARAPRSAGSLTASIEAIAKICKYSEVRVKLLDKGAVPGLVRLVEAEYPDVRRARKKVISELWEHEDLRNHADVSGTVKTLISVLDAPESSPSLRRAGVESISEIYKHLEVMTLLVDLDAGPKLVDLFEDRSKDDSEDYSKMLCASIKVISKLCEYDEVTKPRVLGLNDVHNLACLTQKNDPEVRRASIKVISVFWDPGNDAAASKMIKTLVDLIQGGILGSASVDAISEFCKHKGFVTLLASSGAIRDLVALVKEEAEGLRTASVKAISELWRHDVVRTEILKAGVVAQLVNFLKHDYEEVRMASVNASSVLFGYVDFRTAAAKETIETLVTEAKLPGRKTSRRASVEAIAESCKQAEIRAMLLDPQRVVTLVNLVKDGDLEIRWGSIKIISVLWENKDSRIQANASGMVETLISQVKAEDSIRPRGARGASVEAIAEICKHKEVREKLISSQAVQSFVDLVKDKDSEVRWASIKIIEELWKNEDSRSQANASRIVETLVSQVKAEDSTGSRGASVEAIAEICGHKEVREKLISSQAVQSLVDLVEDKDPEVRWASIKVIEELWKNEDSRIDAEVSKTFGMLVRLIEGRTPVSQQWGVIAIAKICNYTEAGKELIDSHAVSKLVDLLKNFDVEVRSACVDALSVFWEQEDIRKHAISVDVITKLVGLVKENDWGVQSTGVDALLAFCKHDNVRAHLLNEKVVKKLFSLLDDRDSSKVRLLGLKTISKLWSYDDVATHENTPNPFVTLVSLLQDPAPAVRKASAEAIVNLCDISNHPLPSKVFTNLVGLFEDDDPGIWAVKIEAVLALCRHHDFKPHLLPSHTFAKLVGSFENSDVIGEARLQGLLTLAKDNQLRRKLCTFTVIRQLSEMLADNRYITNSRARRALLNLGQYDDVRKIAFKSDLINTLLIMLQNDEIMTCIHGAEMLAALGLFSGTSP